MTQAPGALRIPTVLDYERTRRSPGASSQIRMRDGGGELGPACGDGSYALVDRLIAPQRRNRRSVEMK